MPRGPKGDERPADAIGAAITPRNVAHFFIENI